MDVGESMTYDFINVQMFMFASNYGMTRTIKLLDFERSPPIRARSRICGVICIWGCH
jgi:hypothetical protein